MRTTLTLLFIVVSLSACDSDVHYVKAVPVDPVEQGDLP